MRISDWSSDVCSSDLNLEKHPVKPPPPTGEQLSVPLRPTYSIATARLVQLSFPGALGSSRSASGMRKRSFSPLRAHTVIWSALLSGHGSSPYTMSWLILTDPSPGAPIASLSSAAAGRDAIIPAMAATNLRDFMFRPSASVRRSSDALRQRENRSAAKPYKAEKQGIGRRAFRAGSQSRIAMIYFLRLNRSEEQTSEIQ